MSTAPRAPRGQERKDHHEDRRDWWHRAHRLEGRGELRERPRRPAASPDSGVNTITGEGLDEALDGAQVVVDVSNSPSFEDAAVMEFFETSTRNLIAAEKLRRRRTPRRAVRRGERRLPDSGYMRAKVAQEKLIRDSGDAVLDRSRDPVLRVRRRHRRRGHRRRHGPPAPALFQPIAADDVAAAVAEFAAGRPLNGVVEVAGPERFRFDEFIRAPWPRTTTRARSSPTPTPATSARCSRAHARPGQGAHLGPTRFEDRLSDGARSRQVADNRSRGDRCAVGECAAELATRLDAQLREDLPRGGTRRCAG